LNNEESYKMSYTKSPSFVYLCWLLIIPSTYLNVRLRQLLVAALGQFIPGFCKSVSLSEISEKDCVLTPGRYIGLLEDEDDFDFAEGFANLNKLILPGSKLKKYLFYFHG
jgi:hypothetical protein